MRLIRNTAGVLAVLCFAEVAQAYVLPPAFLFKLLSDRRESTKIVDISAELSTELGSEAAVEERMYMKIPERLRIVEESEEGSLYVEREGVRAAGTAGKVKRLSGPPTDVLTVLLMPRGESLENKAQRITKVLQSAGVDTEMVALGRYEGRPAYVVGARVWEPDKPQVWLDKETLLPVKFVLFEKGAKGGKRYETRLEDYGSAQAGNWLPRVVETHVDGELVRRAEIVSVKINQDLPETLFDVP